MPTEDLHTDKTLLRLVADDNEDAFRDLLNAYSPLCYRIALKVLRDEWQAEDIVQEVFLKIWLRRSKLPDVDNFGAWLRTITSNHLYNYIRKLQLDKNHLDKWWDELQLPSQHGEPATTEESFYEDLLEEAVSQLSPRQQQAFNLIKKEGYTREEAAQQLGIGSETVKTHLEQAMRSIRAYCTGRLDQTSFAIIFSILLKKYF